MFCFASSISSDSHLLFVCVSTAIYAEKVADSLAKPEITVSQALREPRITDLPMHGVGHADEKASPAGPRSTYGTASSYLARAKKRRDDLLQHFGSE